MGTDLDDRFYVKSTTRSAGMLCHAFSTKEIGSTDEGTHWTELHAGLPENRDTNQRRPEPVCLITAIKPGGCQWYAPAAAIYSINMLNFYMHVKYLPKSLLCSSNLDLYHKPGNKSMRGMCSVITWPVGGNTCILSGWVSARQLLLQCQRHEAQTDTTDYNPSLLLKSSKIHKI